MNSGSMWSYSYFYSITTSFLAMKHLHLTEICFGGAAPPGDVKMWCA